MKLIQGNVESFHAPIGRPAVPVVVVFSFQMSSRREKKEERLFLLLLLPAPYVAYYLDKRRVKLRRRKTFWVNDPHPFRLVIVAETRKNSKEWNAPIRSAREMCIRDKFNDYRAEKKRRLPYY